MFHYILLFYMNFMEKTTSCLLRGDSPVNHLHVHCFTGGAIKTNRGKAVNRLLLVAALATTTALAAPAHAVDTYSDLSTWQGAVRSVEHTSELQSLMFISYAVFCLKNKHR